LREGYGGALGIGLERDDLGHHPQGRVIGVDEQFWLMCVAVVCGRLDAEFRAGIVRRS
jgi:hypothetical protein